MLLHLCASPRGMVCGSRSVGLHLTVSIGQAFRQDLGVSRPPYWPLLWGRLQDVSIAPQICYRHLLRCSIGMAGTPRRCSLPCTQRGAVTGARSSAKGMDTPRRMLGWRTSAGRRGRRARERSSTVPAPGPWRSSWLRAWAAMESGQTICRHAARMAREPLSAHCDPGPPGSTGIARGRPKLTPNRRDANSGVKPPSQP